MAVTQEKRRVVTTYPSESPNDNKPSMSASDTILKSRTEQTPPSTDADFDWKPWATALGGGLLLHTLASSFINNKTDEEKRRESIWERLLGAVIPLGLGGLGMYGGYRLGQLMKSGAAKVETNDFVKVTGNGGPGGPGVFVPQDSAQDIDELLKFLRKNDSVDLDTAYQNLLAARKDDEQGFGMYVSPLEAATTYGLPLMYGTGAYKGLKAGWKDFASGARTLRNAAPGAIRKQVNSATNAGSNFADIMANIDKMTPEDQLFYARLNGYKNVKEMNRGMARQVREQQAAANANQAAAGANRRAGAVSVAKGVAKGVAKALPWTLAGMGIDAVDSVLENEQDAQAKRKNLAQWAGNNLPRIQQILDNSKIIDDPDGKTK